MAQIILGEDLQEFLNMSPDNKKGCFVDTNLLFAWDYDLHHWNEQAEEIGSVLVSNNVPIYSNSIIRSELLELKRRVLITEALVDLHSQLGNSLPTNLSKKLKALKEMIRSKSLEDEHHFLGDRQIKDFKKTFDRELGKDKWEGFCKSYLKTKLRTEWENQVATKKVGYISGDDKDFLSSEVSWENMIALVENYGIGTSDAMIINFFLSSIFTFIVTADADVAFCMERMSTQKICVVPAGLNF